MVLLKGQYKNMYFKNLHSMCTNDDPFGSFDIRLLLFPSFDILLLLFQFFISLFLNLHMKTMELHLSINNVG